MNKTELLDLLYATKNETLTYFNLLNDDLEKSYASGKWNVRQILHHLTDCEYLFLGRLKKIIAEPFQVIWAFNQDDWDKTFNYKDEPLGNNKALFAHCRDMNSKLIKTYYDDFGHKEFVHSETGLRTLKMEFEKVAVHNQNHNNQIKMALLK